MPEEPSDVSNEAWLKGLLGEDSTPGKDHHEGESLRRIFRADAAEQTSRIPDSNSQEWERMLFRLKKEGLLKEPTRPSGFWFKSSPRAALSAAASIGAIVVMVGYGALVPQRTEALRSPAADLVVPDPTIITDELQAMTTKLGGQTHIYKLCNGVFDADLPNTAEVLTELQDNYGLTPNASANEGRLHIQIAPEKPIPCSPASRLRDRVVKLQLWAAGSSH